MKKVLPLIGSAIILGGFLAFSLQSTGKLTSTEECNAVVLAEEQWIFRSRRKFRQDKGLL